MNSLNCQEVRNQLMFYMDNELTEEVRFPLVSHLKECTNCIEYFNTEKEIKTKICAKLKDAYICPCNIDKLSKSIKDKISKFCKNSENFIE